MNIVEAHIKLKNQLVILISGLSGTGKTKLAKSISELFKIKFINMNDYCDKNYNKTIKLPSGVEVINWDTDDIYDWNKFNGDMDKYAKDGVIVCGVVFPKDKIKFKLDFHIHIKLNKQNLFKKRTEYLEEHKEDCQEVGRNVDKNIEYTIFNQLTFPYYLGMAERSDITKFINANEYANLDQIVYDEKLFDDAFDYLIKGIEKKIYGEKTVEKSNGKKYDTEYDKERTEEEEESYSLIYQ